MSGASASAGTLPPLPKIEGDVDLMLDVYTHWSLRSSATMNDDYGDTGRLAELGSKVLELAVTNHLFSEKPFIESEKIRDRRNTILSDATINDWLNSYGLKGKLRISPSDQSILEDPEEMRKYFTTYIGALYIKNGFLGIQTWISQLIDPNVEVNLPNVSPPVDQHMASNYPSPQSYHSSPPPPPMSSHAAAQPQFSSYAPPPPFPAPPLPTTPPTAIPTSSNMNLVTLALVNQTAAQRGYQVTYPAVQEGPPHQPTWTVRCCINGKECGIGVGKSQKIAKEVAARHAWTTMGWGPS